GFLIVRFFVSRIVPDTSNTHTRGPEAATQAPSEPAPDSLRLVTLCTVPPRPAGVSMPKPAAPGITGRACALAPHSAAAAINNVVKYARRCRTRRDAELDWVMIWIRDVMLRTSQRLLDRAARNPSCATHGIQNTVTI